MKKIDLLEIESAIHEAAEINEVKMATVLYKNFSKIKEDLIAIKNAIKPNNSMIEYVKELNQFGDIVKCKCCGKDVRIPNNDLKEKYKNVINERILNIQNYDKMLENDEINIEFEKIPFSYVKKSDILNKIFTFNLLNKLSFMIDMNN
jgi:hypothetical protein